ncbi:hypothetical protein DFQ28_009036 [Apophysomyces sp. BC1034]|nr:hypothetical protein DFQ30_008711 [Apophysomyces sp. BC1015]KAG0173862.1 hypothetical protein DFQ29_007699 [Apophysomyces sp. BC1021]KAG0185645.1 hypothetical protein DFQ28_009036 [Apophysomyces sp. BC1034]
MLANQLIIANAILWSSQSSFSLATTQQIKKCSVTNADLFVELEKHFPKQREMYSKHQIALRLGKEYEHFGPLVTHRKSTDDGKPTRGRWLYIAKDSIRESLSESDAIFQKHVRATEGD